MKFEARIKELVENLPDLVVLVEPLLIARRVLREQIGVLHRRLLEIVRDDDVCRRLMTIPDVGPVVALTYRATVDARRAFSNSRAVGAAFDRRPPRYSIGRDQSNRRDFTVRRRDDAGDAVTKRPWHAACARQMVLAQGLGMKIAGAGMKKAISALARRLADHAPHVGRRHRVSLTGEVHGMRFHLESNIGEH